MVDGWNFNGSPENESALRPLCEKVEQYLEPPAARLCRYFAVSDDTNLRDNCQEYYRGFYCPISERGWLLLDLQQCFFHPLNQFTACSFNSFDEMVAFEHLIYIRASTCADPTGCVTTYAHELQHLVQHERTPKLFTVNNVLYKNLKRCEPTATAIDVPSEREANIVSKRIAEAVCGVRAVREFAEKQIHEMEALGSIENRDRWVFFRDAAPLTSYDLVEHTRILIERYKDVIDFGIDVGQPEWWHGAVEK